MIKAIDDVLSLHSLLQQHQSSNRYSEKFRNDRCVVFKASFNRTNLFYEVRPKKCTKEIIDLLKTEW